MAKRQTAHDVPLAEPPDEDMAAETAVSDWLGGGPRQSVRGLLRVAVTVSVEAARRWVYERDTGEASAWVAELPAYQTVTLTTDEVADAMPATPRPSVRRFLGEAVAAGVLRRTAPGQYELDVRLDWPGSDRDARWRIARDGRGVAW